MTKAKAPLAGMELPLEDESEQRPIGKKIRDSIFVALGQPKGLYNIAVRKLWDNRYRVNVMVGPDSITAHMVRSYFVETGENGDIVSSTPKILRLNT